MSEPALAVYEAKRKLVEALMPHANVVGVGIGKEGDEFVLAVYGDPDQLELPSEVDGVRVVLRPTKGPVVPY